MQGGVIKTVNSKIQALKTVNSKEISFKTVNSKNYDFASFSLFFMLYFTIRVTSAVYSCLTEIENFLKKNRVRKVCRTILLLNFVG